MVKCIEDEIPFEIPASWAWARLGTVAEAIGDGDHQPPPQTHSGIPFLVISNVSDGKLSFTETRYVSKEYYDTLPESRKPRNGDLLFTVTGSYGIPVLVDTEIRFCFQRHIAIIHPCIITSQYLYAVLGSSYIKSICDDKATGVAQKTVSLATLRNMLIPVAPLSEQASISIQAESLIQIIEEITSEQKELLEATASVKTRILDLAVRGQLVPQDSNDEPASVLLERIRAEKEELIKQGKIKRDKKESVIFKGEDNSYYLIQNERAIPADETIVFDLPDSWCWTTLPTIANVELGKTLDRAKNTGTLYPYLRSVNIKWGDIDLSDLNETRFEDDELEKYSVIKNDLLICEGGDVGRCCVWNIDEVFLYQNALHRARMYANIEPKFYQYVLMSYESKGILKRISNGVTIKHLTGTTLSFMPIPLPPVDEQLRIIETIELLFAQLDAIKEFLN